MHKLLRVHVCTFVRVCLYVCVCLRVFVCVRVDLCACVLAYKTANQDVVWNHSSAPPVFGVL